MKVGGKYRLIGHHHCAGQTKIHILAIVEGMIVYKWYGKHKQWWHYEICDPSYFDVLREKK